MSTGIYFDSEVSILDLIEKSLSICYNYLFISKSTYLFEVKLVVLSHTHTHTHTHIYIIYIVCVCVHI